MIITQFAGIQNTSSARDIADNALQDAVNVDITNGGGIVARSGYSLAKGLSVSTAYSTFEGATFIISDGVLCQVEQPLEVKPIVASTATEFADYSGVLFTNDGLRVYRGEATSLVVPVPQPPSVVITGGSRTPGRYNVLTTYTNADGLEGGTSQVVSIPLSIPGDLLVTPATLSGFTPNVYITEADGEVFFNAATGAKLLPALINSNSFPAKAEKIEYHESRLYVTERIFDYTVVYRSDPLLFHLYGMDDAYFVVPGAIQDMRSTSQGLVIGTDREIYVYQDGTLTLLASYGVVPGRSMVKLPDRSLLIHTVRGVCKALPFQPLTEANVSLPMGEKCSTHVVSTNGVMKYVATHDGRGEAYNKF